MSALPLGVAIPEGIKTALLTILVYLIALPFVLFAGAGFLIFFIATAWLLMSRSTPLLGLATKSMAPSSSALRVISAPSRDSELTTTIGRGLVDMICSVACKPSRWGMLMSIVTTSGFNASV